MRTQPWTYRSTSSTKQNLREAENNHLYPQHYWTKYQK